MTHRDAGAAIPLLGGSVSFYIQTTSGGGYGPLIDNFAVDITPGVNAVPEPATWALMIAGFGQVGGAMRRRSAFAAG